MFRASRTSGTFVSTYVAMRKLSKVIFLIILIITPSLCTSSLLQLSAHILSLKQLQLKTTPGDNFVRSSFAASSQVESKDMMSLYICTSSPVRNKVSLETLICHTPKSRLT